MTFLDLILGFLTSGHNFVHLSRFLVTVGYRCDLRRPVTGYQRVPKINFLVTDRLSW